MHTYLQNNFFPTVSRKSHVFPFKRLWSFQVLKSLCIVYIFRRLSHLFWLSIFYDCLCSIFNFKINVNESFWNASCHHSCIFNRQIAHISCTSYSQKSFIRVALCPVFQVCWIPFFYLVKKNTLPSMAVVSLVSSVVFFLNTWTVITLLWGGI